MEIISCIKEKSFKINSTKKVGIVQSAFKVYANFIMM